MNLNEIKNKYIIITGEKNSGKTEFLIDLTNYFKVDNKNYGGIITTKELINNAPVNYFVTDISENNKILLCSSNMIDTKIKTGKYYFSEKGINFGNNAIAKAISENKNHIIIDEIGPLEINNRGWHQSLLQLRKSKSQFIISARKTLIQKIIDKYELNDNYIIDIN